MLQEEIYFTVDFCRNVNKLLEVANDIHICRVGEAKPHPQQIWSDVDADVEVNPEDDNEAEEEETEEWGGWQSDWKKNLNM